ncbi:MAG: class I SAM-dependent methyltransferase [Bdellovibrionaceae bacterium]|nr:class I SAM-dependent methyltransferase [Bdellovibrionales bacterium]MCB9082706.1 class I SAM-dependent methyltransferase [Pseudobdellovibrionaceae bacterium]
MKSVSAEGKSLREKSIEDFGDQWTRYQDNEGYYGSSALFADMLSGLMTAPEFVGKEVLDVGSGTGRIVHMILTAGAQTVHAVEPSKAMDVLRQNLAPFGDRVVCHQVAGDQIPNVQVDLATSIGVLHHIPEPEPVVKKVFAVLKPGGRFLFWVYGYEGNEAYLRLIMPLRKLTARLPDFLLRGFCHLLNVALAVYVLLCRVLPLPLRGYMNEVIGHFSWKKRFLVIFDQLNPAYARYYTGDEAEKLMADGGFTQIQRSHRHGYSWTVIGVKPENKSKP